MNTMAETMAPTEAQMAALRMLAGKDGSRRYGFEADCCTRSMGLKLEALGYVTRMPGRHGRPTTLRLTDKGVAALFAGGWAK